MIDQEKKTMIDDNNSKRITSIWNFHLHVNRPLWLGKKREKNVSPSNYLIFSDIQDEEILFEQICCELWYVSKWIRFDGHSSRVDEWWEKQRRATTLTDMKKKENMWYGFWTIPLDMIKQLKTYRRWFFNEISYVSFVFSITRFTKRNKTRNKMSMSCFLLYASLRKKLLTTNVWTCRQLL